MNLMDNSTAAACGSTGKEGGWAFGSEPECCREFAGPTGINIYGVLPLTGMVVTGNVMEDESIGISFNSAATVLGKATVDGTLNWWGCPQGSGQSQLRHHDCQRSLQPLADQQSRMKPRRPTNRASGLGSSRPLVSRNQSLNGRPSDPRPRVSPSNLIACDWVSGTNRRQ